MRVAAPDVGGGFGEKGGLYPEEIAIPYLALLLDRPVKWAEERWENLLAFHGRGHTVDVEAAVQRDGTLLRDAMVAPSFEVKRKVLQLVVQRIVVEDHRITIEHVVPSGPIRLQPEHPTAANPITAGHVSGNISPSSREWPSSSLLCLG